MAEPSTSTEMVRVPILGENGRISDDYIPESIPQAVTAAEQAAESAASSANQALQQAAAAEKAASSATGSVEQAKTYANNASTYMSTAESHAESAATDAQAASNSASAAAASAAAAEVSNKSAAQSSADAMGFRNNAVQYRDQAREAAQEAQGYVTTVQQLEQNATNSATAAQNSATSASASAETATTAASQASTSATSAAASAQTASQKADAVLDHYIESATATTLEPGSQATATVADKVLQLGIPKGDKGDPGDVSAVQTAEGSDLSVSTEAGTVTIDDSALRARIAELENQAANVVTGTSTGLVAHGEDAYAQKPREVRIKGKTWVNRWPEFDETTTINGVTLTCDETGLFTLSGTATSLTFFSKPVNGLAAGKQVALSKSGGTGFMAYLTVGSNTQNIAVSVSTSNTATGTIASDATAFNVHIRVDSGTTVNASFRVMLVDGTEAPDCFTPCASITSVQPGNLVTSGKNLYKPFTAGKVTANDDGSMTVWASAETWANGTLNSINLPAGTQITLSTDDIYGVNVGFGVFFFASDNSHTEVPLYNLLSRTIELSEDCVAYQCWFNGSTDSKVTARVMMEIGSTATSFEPYQGSTTALPEVELRSLPNGACDELVIKADGTCEVERSLAKETFGEGTDTGTGAVQTGDTYQYVTINPSKMPIDGDVFFLCDRFSVGGRLPNNVYIAGGIDNARFYFTFPLDTFSDRREIATWFAANPTTVVYRPKDGPTTEPQSPVTLPALPAPTFNQYHDSPVPSDTSTEYARDINIVLANLEAKVSELIVNQATS